MVAEPDPTRASIPAEQRLIVALDVPDVEAAKRLVERLGDSAGFYKIGLELAMSRGYFDLLDWLIGRGKQVFADLKLYDIPATVGRAVRRLADSGAALLTVHAERSITAAAAQAKGPDLKVLGVTVLTSMSPQDLRDGGIEMDLAALVLKRARDAVGSGCDGIVTSGLEARALRAALGPGPLIVTPGIRPAGRSEGMDDQRRVVTPADAIRAGADHVVVGRPIRDAKDPCAAASAIQAEIARAAD